MTRLASALADNLTAKILLLVLTPLLLSSVSLLVIEGRDRQRATAAQLDEQRELLIESRQQAVRGHIELAKTMIQSMQATPLDTEEAQSLAIKLLNEMRFDGDNYIFAFTQDGEVLVQPAAPQVVGTNMLEATDPNGNRFIAEMADLAAQGGGTYLYDWIYPETGEPEPKYSYADGIDEWGWVLGAGVYITDVESTMDMIAAQAWQDMTATFTQLVVIAVAINVGIFAVAFAFARRTARRIRYTSRAINDIAGDVAEGRGDLTLRVDVQGTDDIGQLGQQFNTLLESLQSMLRDVRRGAGAVTAAAQDIAQGSNDLASRTEQAAANLQETSSAMEQITATVDNNAANAQQANQLVQASAAVAQRGQAAMEQVETTMNDINVSSNRISDIVTMIDAIAFQTNILALNASVEAARAGEHGRGFAVVAQEVRTLAQRSADASQEIRRLIEQSVKHSRHGSEIVHKAGETMQEIAHRVVEITDVIGDITAGSQEQSTGIGEVNTAVSELDTMTQQNTALVEQSLSAASQMLRQAETLADLVSGLKLDEDDAQGESAWQLIGSGSEPQPSLPARSGARQAALPSGSGAADRAGRAPPR